MRTSTSRYDLHQYCIYEYRFSDSPGFAQQIMPHHTSQLSHLKCHKLKAAQFMPLKIYLSDSASTLAKIWIFAILHITFAAYMILYGMTIRIRRFIRQIQLANRWAPWKFASDSKKVVLQQAQHFRKLGSCRKFIGRRGISHYRPREYSIKVNLI